VAESWGEPPRTGGRHHAEPSSRSGFGGQFLAALGAVAAVAAVVLVLVAVRGHSPGTGPGPGVIVAPTTSPVVTPQGTTTPTVVLTHPAPSPVVTTKPEHHGPPAWRTAMAQVRVYNSTHITGLAHGVAADIAAKGWKVPIVGNVIAKSPITTLYYSPHAKDAARHLAHQFPGIHRIRPNSEEALDYKGLTLILTADWQG
jgi:hypothetical protein